MVLTPFVVVHDFYECLEISRDCNQSIIEKLSARTKFNISNISQFHLKRENLNQIGSNNSAKFSILLKTIPMNNDENIESDCAL